MRHVRSALCSTLVLLGACSKPAPETTPAPSTPAVPPAAPAPSTPAPAPVPAAANPQTLPAAPAAPAAPPAQPLTDAQWIDLLLNDLENSPDRFIRNGTEYSGKDAADHLRSKLKTAGSRVKTRDDFLTGLATTSSMSGKPYMVKRAEGTTITAREWFDADIARIKAGAK